uniref:Uncharacterized protein n=1 Tax=Florenciella parvula TaxID=236787 RepID=A0A7S2C2S1_9STRA|mmetsp:Transcript_23529/g.48723  ORF Transcript_23529/g.48723 Transcript_23529/m.48723 type:complete len:203 (+) Transcript_23529:59-667(+)
MAARAERAREVKVVLLGDTGVGKSSLVLRFITNEFKPYQESTIGASFMSKLIMVEGAPIKFQIWDTAGQERFRTITSAYYRGADGIIMVYDVTSQDSFNHVADWLTEVNRYASEGTCKLLVGNKSDREDRAVSSEEASAYAEKLKIPFLETSAKNAENVETAFLTMASELIKIRQARGPAATATGTTKLGEKSGKSSRSCCK